LVSIHRTHHCINRMNPSAISICLCDIYYEKVRIILSLWNRMKLNR
jgi:hypothetical protein